MYMISATEETDNLLFLLQSGKPPINDMFTDLKDGRKLLDLLEGLTGTSLVRGVIFENQAKCLSSLLILEDPLWVLTV